MSVMSLRRLVWVLAVVVGARVGAVEWVVSTVAGTGVQGFSGDGGPAVSAKINNPFGLVRGPDGALWFWVQGTVHSTICREIVKCTVP